MTSRMTSIVTAIVSHLDRTIVINDISGSRADTRSRIVEVISKRNPETMHNVTSGFRLQNPVDIETRRPSRIVDARIRAPTAICSRRSSEVFPRRRRSRGTRSCFRFLFCSCCRRLVGRTATVDVVTEPGVPPACRHPVQPRLRVLHGGLRRFRESDNMVEIPVGGTVADPHNEHHRRLLPQDSQV